MKRLAWFLAFTVGFLSLSLEILWIRLIGFIQMGAPQSFAIVLGLFLFGVACGAAAGKRACADARRAITTAGVLLGLAGLLDLSLPRLLISVPAGVPTSALAYLLVFASAALKAAIFPIAHHLGSSDAGETLGRSLSKVYCMNILGSTMGPLLTGFVLLDHVSLSAGMLFVGVGCLLVAAVIFIQRAPLATLLCACGALVAGVNVNLRDDGLIRKLAVDGTLVKVRHVIETRQGIVHTTVGDQGADIVFGGNAYDGRTTFDLKSNTNKIDRAYLLTSLHAAPKRVLVIGLSTGAWTRVMSAIESVVRIDVVEINPGYLDLIARYPNLAPLLRDPKLRIHIDDGRRWLKRHPGEQYDLIVMNTTFHWRANITNLLSQQFMAQLKAHLAPGGIVAFNATGSADAFQTAASVFPHAFQWSNFIYCAEWDFRPDDQAAMRRRLLNLHLEGAALLSAASADDEQALRVLISTPFIELDTVRKASPVPLRIITDSNMITEFK